MSFNKDIAFGFEAYPIFKSSCDYIFINQLSNTSSVTLYYQTSWKGCLFRILNLSQTPRFSQKLNVGFRRVPWRHRSAFSQREVVSQWTACVLFMHELQELHRTNEPKPKPKPDWIRATRLGCRPCICSDRSRWAALDHVTPLHTEHREIQQSQ